MSRAILRLSGPIRNAKSRNLNPAGQSRNQINQSINQSIKPIRELTAKDAKKNGKDGKSEIEKIATFSLGSWFSEFSLFAFFASFAVQNSSRVGVIKITGASGASQKRDRLNMAAWLRDCVVGF
jgi:hypothetical protein